MTAKKLPKHYPIIKIIDTYPSILIEGNHTIKCKILNSKTKSEFFLEVGDTLELKE